MADQKNRNSGDSNSGGSGSSSGSSGSSGSDQAGLDRSLQRGNDDLAGDIETNRNLSGSSTYETLREQGDLDVREVDGGDQAEGNRRGSSGNQSGGSSGGMR